MLNQLQLFAILLASFAVACSRGLNCDWHSGNSSDGWVPHGASCYKWIEAPDYWYPAEQRCLSSGGHLVSINDRQENTLVGRLTYCLPAWIGLYGVNAEQLASSSQYRWTDGTVSSANKHNFSRLTTPHQPLVTAEGLNWYNNLYHASSSYVCEVPASPSAWDNQVGEASGCPAGWRRMGEYCYLQPEFQATYIEAGYYCDGRQAQLVSIHSERELRLLSLLDLNQDSCSLELWVGLVKLNPCRIDFSSGQQVCYRWADRTGDHRGFPEWAAGHPIGDLVTNCVVLKDRSLRSEFCYSRRNFVCKRPARLPTPKPPTGPPTRPPTGPPTQPSTGPPTRPPTGPPTRPPTGPPTQPPTGPPTRPPTGPPTQPPTGPPTRPPTGPPTQPPTGPPTRPPTGPPTQPPTGPPTRPPTGPPTQPPTGPPTRPPTGPPTRPPTGPPTQPPTEPPTRPPTGPPTQPPTEPPTRPPTGPPTQPPTGPPTGPTQPPTELPNVIQAAYDFRRGRENLAQPGRFRILDLGSAVLHNSQGAVLNGSRGILVDTEASALTRPLKRNGTWTLFYRATRAIDYDELLVDISGVKDEPSLTLVENPDTTDLVLYGSTGYFRDESDQHKGSANQQPEVRGAVVFAAGKAYFYRNSVDVSSHSPATSPHPYPDSDIYLMLGNGYHSALRGYRGVLACFGVAHAALTGDQLTEVFRHYCP